MTNKSIKIDDFFPQKPNRKIFSSHLHAGIGLWFLKFKIFFQFVFNILTTIIFTREGIGPHLIVPLILYYFLLNNLLTFFSLRKIKNYVIAIDINLTKFDLNCGLTFNIKPDFKKMCVQLIETTYYGDDSSKDVVLNEINITNEHFILNNCGWHLESSQPYPKNIEKNQLSINFIVELMNYTVELKNIE